MICQLPIPLSSNSFLASQLPSAQGHALCLGAMRPAMAGAAIWRGWPSLTVATSLSLPPTGVESSMVMGVPGGHCQALATSCIRCALRGKLHIMAGSHGLECLRAFLTLAIGGVRMWLTYVACRCLVSRTAGVPPSSADGDMVAWRAHRALAARRLAVLDDTLRARRASRGAPLRCCRAAHLKPRPRPYRPERVQHGRM